MDDEYIANAQKAGNIAARALQHGASLIKPGATYKNVYNEVLRFIEKNGGFPAFPPQMSFDDTAAHFMIGIGEDVTFENQLIKLDIGVSVNGVIGDNALTIDLSGNYKDLVAASRDAVNAVVKLVKLGVTLHEIGSLIEQTANDAGFQPVRNLSGHGLGTFIVHAPPTIPNYANNDKKEIKPGMHFACEPFVTDGKGEIHEVGKPEIFRLDAKRPTRDPSAKKILNFVEKKYGSLPFATPDLEELKLPAFKLKVALRQLVQQGCLQAYGPLVEVTKGMVSQAEHTFLILPNGEVQVTTLL